MARIRSIKPEFFTSDTVTALPIRARLTWIGMWTHCDDHGRCRDSVRLIKAAVWPLDDITLRDVAEDLEALIHAGLVFKYEAAGKRYLQVTGWSEHQKVDHPSKSPIPPPPPLSTSNGSYPQENPRDALASPRDTLDQEGRGKEGKGGGARARADPGVLTESPPAEPPPQTCNKHPDGTDDPCRRCQRAREAHQQWQHDQAAARAEQTRRRQQQPRCRCGTRHLPDETCEVAP